MTTATRPRPRTGSRVYTGPHAKQINHAARRNGIDAWLLAALLFVESGLNPHAVSATGDYGIAQINLAAHPTVTKAEALNPGFAIPWAARYLAELKTQTGSTNAALRAYNTGSAAKTFKGNRYADTVLGARTAALKAAHRLPRGTALSGANAGVDQGVDFTARGAIPVLDAATVTDVGTVHIRQGANVPYVVYRLDAGPHRGKFVYVMETFNPTVKVGQRLAAGKPIGYATGGGYGIEIGWNKTAKGQNAVGPDPTRPNPAGYGMLQYLKRRGLSHGGASVPMHQSGGGGGGVTGFVEGAAGGALHLAEQAADPLGLFSGGNPVKSAWDTATAFGSLASKILTDPGYIILWLGFAIMGLAFVFIGIERLLGRSAAHDVRSAATIAAVPEAAAVGGVA